MGKSKGKKEPAPPPRDWTDDLESDLQRILSVGEECISEAELKNLISRKGRGTEKYADDDVERTTDVAPRIRLYDGFEPSGRMHIAQGLLKSVNVNKCTEPGSRATFVFWVADWFALMNDKMGGDLDKIVTVGKYLVEVWKASGMNLENVEFRWASDEITNNASVYWPLMLDIARRFNVTRIKKCCQIMGRLEGNLSAAQVMYPLMQCTDVFYLKSDICQLGVDQRKVNMLAREYCDAAKIRNKPVILSHHMLYGLKEGQEKMSKSDPDSAIFMEDTPEDVERKIGNAYCPTKVKDEEIDTKEEEKASDDAGKESMQLVEDRLKNPILDYVQHIVLSPPGATFECANNSNDAQVYAEFAAVKEDFMAGRITPGQLKEGLIKKLNELLNPVRKHFAEDPVAKGLFEQVKQFKREAAAVSTSDGDVPKLFRLDLVESGAVQPSSHLVFAPLPNSNPTLQSAADLLAKLKAGGDAPKVLMLSDWTAMANGALDADAKLISAYYAILIASMRALDAHLHGEEGSVMNSVTVLTQSDALLKDPSNYWISVINAGRHFNLNTVMGLGIGLSGEDVMKDSEGVGKVVGRLMLVADVLGVNPKSIAFELAASAGSVEGVVDGVEKMSLDSAPAALSVESLLVKEFYAAKVSHPVWADKLPPPQITHVSKGPKLSLQPPRESAAHKLETDEYFLADDPNVNVKSKMKKAYCDPSNVDFCPPIEVLAYLGGLDGDGEGVTITRKPENGGDVTYNTKAAVVEDFGSGALHPGDLKAAVSIMMVDVMTKINSAIKADEIAAKGVKALKAFEKKMSKKKK